MRCINPDRAEAHLCGVYVTRRGFFAVLASLGVSTAANWSLSNPGWAGESASSPAAEPDYSPFKEAVSNVFPEKGAQTQVILKDSIIKLVNYGVIHKRKIFPPRRPGFLPPQFAEMLSERSDLPILLTRSNANYYVNLLWPVGLATRMNANTESPVNGSSLFNLASTGGWTLGRAPNGGVYFNKYPIVQLTQAEEALVFRLAKSIYRPCCNNSTFYQDCNHGSALLGVLQLGASQGLGEAELYRQALIFNSFWFPDIYVRTALFFKIFKKTDWAEVDPKLILSFDYSALGPWQENVSAKLDRVPNLIPQGNGAVNCGL